jgi:hypothetical protein
LIESAGLKAGLIGALLGFVLGYVDYKIVIDMIQRRLRQVEEGDQTLHLDKFEMYLRRMRLVVFVMTIVAFPVIGFLAGVFLLDTPQ